MKKAVGTIIISMFFISYMQSQTLKNQALDEFKKEHYNEAITLMEKALIEFPNDAEIYYYLGWFNHYRAYDSRPLSGYNYAYSEKIFEYFDKAIEINPQYGDAKYFYGVECSANAFAAMQNYDLEKLKYFYKKAYEKGAYPAWLIELGKNFMNSCDKNAILFTGGNIDWDICMYLQLHQHYRTDITVISIGIIERPWYVKFLKDGIEGGLKKVKINLTDHQIMDIHPFKWDTTEVFIPVPAALKVEFNLDSTYQLRWNIEPDLSSNRMHVKIDGEDAKKRTYLSPQRAILLQIIENNWLDRPVYFSIFSEPTFYGGLDLYFRNCGLTSQLVPVETANTNNSIDVNKLESLLKSENLKDYSTVKTNDIPRISGALLGYRMAFLSLAKRYRQNNQTAKLDELVAFYKSNIAIGLEYEEEILQEALSVEN